jgi:hypothetical protein
MGREQPFILDAPIGPAELHGFTLQTSHDGKFAATEQKHLSSLWLRLLDAICQENQVPLPRNKVVMERCRHSIEGALESTLTLLELDIELTLDEVKK